MKISPQDPLFDGPLGGFFYFFFGIFRITNIPTTTATSSPILIHSFAIHLLSFPKS